MKCTVQSSSFQVKLEKPILIPREAKYCWLVCQSAEIWNTSPNILTGVNDLFPISDGMGALVITIPQGLYDISLLNAEINRQIVESGRPADSVVIIGNNATQKTIIQLKTIGTTVDFTGAQTVRDILGFNAVSFTSTVADELFDAQNVANFNTIDFFILHTDLVQHGVRINSKYSQAVAQVLIEAPTGNQIKHQPQNPEEIPAPELIGDRRDLINIWLTDDRDNRVDTAGENYSMRLVIYYLVPYQ